jgi:type I restriction-modification system DNA methylase subunit
MPIKKSELYSSLWKSCDELRGGMDASQYKDYVLVLLFVKYVFDKYAGQKDALLDAAMSKDKKVIRTTNGPITAVSKSKIIGQQPADQLPWFHLITILTKIPGDAEREWYAARVDEHLKEMGAVWN